MHGVTHLIDALVNLAKPLAEWFAGNAGRTGETTPYISPTQHLSPAEQKAALLQDQVNSKIHWDAPESEVLEWLSARHRISGEQAQAMLKVARRTRVRAIRERSLYGLAAAGIGILGTSVPLALEVLNGYFWPLKTAALLAALGFCLFWFGKYLVRFLSGRTDSTVD